MNNFQNYINIMRLSQSIKHIFVIPGVIFGYYLTKELPELHKFIFSLISIILIASSNYIMNEICDRHYDIHHELKKNRVLTKKKISLKESYYLYFFCLFTGLLIAKILVNNFFFLVTIIFFISAIIYNIQPLRFKNIPIIDVITESFNNPIRLLLGFSLFFPKVALPSLSLIISYWLAGAFLMNSKRLSEVIFFQKKNNISKLKKYRLVYNFYNFQNLNCLSFFYGSTSLSFLSIFIIKYKIEFILLLPLLIFIFSIYHYYSINEAQKMQNVKNLINLKLLIGLILLLIISFIYLTFNQIKILEFLLKQDFIYLMS